MAINYGKGKNDSDYDLPQGDAQDDRHGDCGHLPE